MDATIDQMRQLLAPRARELGFGTMAFFVKVHNQDIFDIDAQQFTTHVTKEGNPEAIKYILQLIKGQQAAGVTGNLSFTIDFKDGQAKKLVVNDSDKHRIK